MARNDPDEPLTLPFQSFWSWVVTHPNCILRAGTPEAVLYDDEDLHWTFGAEDTETLLVQLLRGKRFVGEILVAPEHVTYVEGAPGDVEGEYVFELIAESERDRISAYFFVMAHGFDVEDPSHSPGRVH